VTNAELLSTEILKELGENHLSTSFLESGSTSAAYKVHSSQSVYILRIANPNVGKTASYESDFQLRNSLFGEGLPVAKPIATNESFNFAIKEVWAFDDYRAGNHPTRGKVAPLVSKQLGSMLQVMHKLPVSGFGRLENSRDAFVGIKKTPECGLLTRFESPWPFTTEALEDHPAVIHRPSLNRPLQRLRSELTVFVRDSKPSITHTDLHEGQFLVVDDGLSALLDFNEIVAGRSEWDFGSYLYFHGRECLSDLLDGYCSSSSEKADLTAYAGLAAILIALHHGNRGKVLGRPHRIEASVRFLEENLF